MKVSIKYSIKQNGFFVGQTLSNTDKGYKHCNYGYQLVETWQKKQSEYLLRGELVPVTWKTS